MAIVTALVSVLPAAAGPRKAAAKPATKTAAKPAPRNAGIAAKTPSETVRRLIEAMRRKDRVGISDAFNWKKFAAKMNELIPDGKGLEAAVYKTLLVETLSVERNVSDNLRVGKETKTGPDTVTVEMRRVFPSGTGKGVAQIKTINILSLGKEKDGLWRIFRLDSPSQPANVSAPKPPIPHAPQGMVPAATPERK
jgi:hypothetical protein